MIARIKTNNSFYDSIVFAIYNKGWKTEALVFNQDYTALQFVKIWLPKRNVFIYNADTEGWIKKKEIEGYDWVIQNVTRKRFKTKINEAILDRCKKLQANVKQNDWFNIKNTTDIEGLMYASFGFHDSYVRKMYVVAEKHYILFDTTWDCEILFELDGNVETNLFVDYGCIVIDNEFLEILDSTMFFEDGFFYWVDEDSVASFAEIQNHNLHYFRAKNVRWKFIINDAAIWGKVKS